MLTLSYSQNVRRTKMISVVLHLQFWEKEQRQAFFYTEWYWMIDWFDSDRFAICDQRKLKWSTLCCSGWISGWLKFCVPYKPYWVYVKEGHNVEHCRTSPYDKNTPEKSAAAPPLISSPLSKWQFDEIGHQSTYFDLTYLSHHSSTSDIECLNNTTMMKEYSVPRLI